MQDIKFSLFGFKWYFNVCGLQRQERGDLISGINATTMAEIKSAQMRLAAVQ